MILVTGGTGLVGAHLLYQLTLKKHKIRALYRKKSNLIHVKNVFAFYTNQWETLFNTIEWIAADITDVPSLSVAFENITHVYHIAGLISFNEKDNKQLRKVNIEGTANIVNLCIAHKVEKLCFTSSIATLGKTDYPNPITEDSHWNPESKNNSYAISKYGAEIEVWRGTQEGVNAIIVNPGVILGAGYFHQGSGQLFQKIRKGLKYYTQGITGYIDVEDVVKSMIYLMEKKEISNEQYILVTENWSFKTLFDTIANAFRKSPPKREANTVLLKFAAVIDYLFSIIGGKTQTLTSAAIKAAVEKSHYNSSKVKAIIPFEFTPIQKTITNVVKRMSLLEEKRV